MPATEGIVALLRLAKTHEEAAEQAVGMAVRMADEAAGIAWAGGFGEVAALLRDAAMDLQAAAGALLACPVGLDQAIATVDAVGKDASAEQVSASFQVAELHATEAMAIAHEQVIALAQQAHRRLSGVLEGANPELIVGATIETESRLDEMTLCIDDAVKVMAQEAKRARSLGSHTS